MSKHRVLLVDDEPFNFELIKPVLEQDYELDFVDAGEACLERVNLSTPDIILMDIEMPGMDGYETCKKLKTNGTTQNIPVTFVSGLDSVEERLKGYEVGGDDYVIKPFSAKELRSKIEVAIKNKTEKDQLQKNATEAMGTAMTAMTSAGELGVVLHFFEASFHAKTSEALAQLVLDSMSNYGLNCSVRIQTPYEEVVLSGTGKPNPLEKELMEVLKSKGRIFDFGNRSVINFEHVSLLIKNMPCDDQDKYGRIKDNVAILIEGAEARVNSILVEEKLRLQQKALQEVMAGAKMSLQRIDDKQQKYKKANMAILDNLIQGIEASFMHLGLSEEQESALLSTAQGAIEKALKLYDQGYKMDKELENVIHGIEKVVKD
ncbi:response regulator [Kaarinaea lacus]